MDPFTRHPLGGEVDDGASSEDPSAGSARSRAALTRWRRLATSYPPTQVAAMLAAGVRKRTKDADPIGALLFSAGRYPHRRRTAALPSYRLLPFELPAGVHRVGRTRFTVEVDKVTTYCGFSYVPGGWHPFSALIDEYERDRSLRYEDSVLCRLYERFTPRTVAEALFLGADEAAPPLTSLPAVHHVMSSLWRLDARSMERLAATAPHSAPLDDHARFLGPKSLERGTKHFTRVLSAYESVRRHGFQPARFGGSQPRGYFLVRGDDHRFVASGLNHRLPALKAVGTPRFVARFLERHPPVVDEADLARWSVEQGGGYPLATARSLFDRMFSATGSERARALGLLGVG
jgi:hypothetical protein